MSTIALAFTCICSRHTNTGLFLLDTRLRGHMLRRYYSRCSTLRHILPERIRVISLVHYDPLALYIFHQFLRSGDVVLLTRRQNELQRVAQSVNTRVNLRAESTSTSA